MGKWFRWTEEADNNVRQWRQEGVKRDEICTRLGITLRQLKKRTAALDLAPSNAKADVIRKTHAQFVQEMAERHPHIEVVGRYTTALAAIEMRCTACGHAAAVIPNNALRQGACAKCAEKAIGQVRRQGGDVIKQRLVALFPEYTLTSTPELAKDEAHYLCALGHIGSSTVKDMLQGKGCLKCAQSGRDSEKTLLADPKRAATTCFVYFVQHVSGRDKVGIACNGAEARSSQYKKVYHQIQTTRAIAWAIERNLLIETQPYADEEALQAEGFDDWGGWTELRRPLPQGQIIARMEQLLDKATANGWQSIL